MLLIITTMAVIQETVSAGVEGVKKKEERKMKK